MKFPIKINPKIIIVGVLSLTAIFVPQLSSYLGALSAVVESQPDYNSEKPAIEVTPSWGCTHISKAVHNGI